jgi:hypothetical protein
MFICVCWYTLQCVYSTTVVASCVSAGWSGVRSGGGIDVVMTCYVLEVVCSIKNRVFAVCVCVCVCLL